MGVELGDVPAAELLPPGWVVAEPPTQLIAGCGVAEPPVQGQGVPGDPARPQPVDEEPGPGNAGVQLVDPHDPDHGSARSGQPRTASR